MPTIEISKKDFEKLAGAGITEQTLSLSKAEIESSHGDSLKLAIADTNRPDLWSTEGLAREIIGKFTEIKTKPSGLKVIVDKNLADIRPKTVCAVIKNIKITQDVLNQIIQLQEKICETYGRRRKQVAIGVYDFDKISSPVTFSAFSPKEIKFMPLDLMEILNLNQIIEKHPKGKEYGHLLQGFSKYPIFMDAKKEVLSMPPIINSDYTGKVTTKTKNLFIECSGFDMKFLEPALNVVVYSLAQRGGSILTVEVKYPEKTIITPDLKPKSFSMEVSYFNRRSGLNLSKQQVISLLNKSNYRVTSSANDKINILYPCYRQDIMHQADIVEDLMIRYGYNKITPIPPLLSTKGKLLPIQELQNKIAGIMVGLKAQEVLSYTLNNEDNLFRKMNLEPQPSIEIDNAVSKNWSIFRSWITPCLIEFMSKNTTREYPQKVFELGQVVIPSKTAETMSINPVKLAYAEASKNTDFTSSKQALDFLMSSLGISYSISETEHTSFIKGRVGKIMVKGKQAGIIGEIHPQVLLMWGIEIPISVFELSLSELI